MPTQSTSDALQSPLAGKSVCFAGRFHTYTQEPFLQFLQAEGVKVVDEIDEALDYLVLGSTGFATQRKKAEQLNQKKGASIAIVDESQFVALLAPTLDVVLELLRSGQKGIERLNRLFADFRFQSLMPNLTGQDLRKADLRKWRSNYYSWVLDGVDLREADLSESGLSFQNCQLDGAKFENAAIRHLVDCSATDADFSKSTMLHGHGQLRNTNFARSKFHGVKLMHVGFPGCKFDEADLRGADLTRSVLTGVSLRGADLSDAVLAEAKLDGADLGGCKFVNANLTSADLTGANVEGTDFTGANLAGTVLDQVDVSKAIGLDPAATKPAATIGPAVAEWTQACKNAQKLATSVRLEKDKQEVTVHLTIYPGHGMAQDDQRNYWGYSTAGVSVPKTPDQLLTLVANRWAGATPIPSSITVSASKASLPSKELKVLAVNMWCELFGVPAPSAEDLKQQKKAAQAGKTSQVEQWVQTLRTDASGVDKWNNDTSAIKQLKGKLHGIDLSRTNLAGWRCEHMDCKDSDFSEADLRKTMLQGTRFNGTNFTQANLQECYLLYASLKNAQCQRADLTGADLRHADLCGADFTGAILKDAKLDGAKFDEATKFPKGFKPTLDMKWQGAGASPAHAQQVAKLKAKKPLDIDAFMKRLEAGVDTAKLAKALSMLKADRFRLYAQVQDDHLVGIVKSQGDPDLVYSCKLASDGTYGCCTQNLNICGGLRGSLCKHLLVLIVGLTRAGDLDPNAIDTWVLASRGQKPALDKDAMSETFLRYKGAEAGEVDWRPTETIPEDYYAM